MGRPSLDAKFVVVGDTKSPSNYNLSGADYLDLPTPSRTPASHSAKLCPTRHYARKNIGYLWAIRQGADIIIETDDDNIPRDGFWLPRRRTITARTASSKGWCNAYAYFSDAFIWPRGLPPGSRQGQAGAV